MEPVEIAVKYVLGHHDALTDSQEIKDMVADIEEYAKEYCIKNVKFRRLQEATTILSGIIASGAYDNGEIGSLVGMSYEIVEELIRQGGIINPK